MRKDIKLLKLRHKIEKLIQHHLEGHLLGAGTDLTNGIMDVSFQVEQEKYKLTLEAK